jgi:putative ABC transport system permease protein
VQGAERGPEAVIFRVSSENLGHVLIKYNSEMDATELISAIGITWGKIDPYHEFKYDFYTQKIEEYYASSKDMLKIFGAIAFFAVLISFLGLFGIVMYSVESRVKEVGIRRVFGAKISQVIWTLSRRFMIMIFIAILISTPLVWFSGNLILQNFYYRITISFQHFLFGMFCMVGLGLVSILTQTFNASYKNPVETLRYE